MMRTSLGIRLAMTLAALVTLAPASSVAAQLPAPAGQEQPQLFTIDELDNLLAPIALYPDPILAQVLVAATYPDQIALAARYVRTYGDRDIDLQGWDVSVKAVARYLPVLNMLAEGEDWTVAVGQAYALQPGDVMASVQGLREMAYAQGNLVSTAEQRVEYAPRAIRIIPAQPRVIYVPTYDPGIIYYQPVYYARARTSYWSFGIAFPIGVWLAYDMDWDHHDIYYHGWHGYGRQHTWYHVSRPFIAINTVYVNPYRTVVVINRNVVYRHVTYNKFDRYNTVHRKVAWDRRDLPGRGNEAQRGRPGKWNDDARGGERAGERGGERGSSGRRVAEESKAPKYVPETNRVTPTRIGGNNRPLYPAKDAVEAKRTAQPRGAQPRGAEPRSAPDFKPVKTSASQSGAYSSPSRSSGERYSSPSRSAGTYSSPMKAPKANGSSGVARSAPRTSAPTRTAPSQAAPRAPKSSPERSGARSAPSAPRASSAPVKSQGKPQASRSSQGSSRAAKPSGKGKPEGGE